MRNRYLIITVIASVLLGQGQAYAQKDLSNPFEDQPDTLETVYVTAVKEKMKNTTQTGLMRFDAEQIRTGVAVLGTPDVIKTLQTLPGVASGNELMSGLYVHGGDGNDNLFLLDGVPLYNVSHFGGLFSTFNTDVMSNLDFYKSGFPARYGGRLSSVVDVETNEGGFQEYHGRASLGLIDGRFQLDGPIVRGKTSFNLGLRRSWMDIITTPAIAYANRRNGDNTTVDGAYAMSDINARLTHMFSDKSKVNVCLYWGNDHMRASMDQPSSALKIDVRWGSLATSAMWDYKFSDRLKGKLAAYYTNSNSDTGYDVNAAGTGLDDDNASSVSDLGLKWDFDWYPNPSHHVRWGVGAIRHGYHSGRGYTQTISFPKPSVTTGDESTDYSGWEPSAYVEDEIFLAWNLTLNAGLRFALFGTDGALWASPEPRAAVKWMLSKDACMKLSYTRMSQYSHLVSAMYMDLPTNSWMPSTSKAAPMTSDQVAGGVYFTPGKFTVNLEGWYKTMNHMLAYNGANAFYPPLTNWENSFTEGKGRSWGAEFELSWRNAAWELSAYYTLSWSQRLFEAYYADWFSDRNDNRHKVNLVASHKFDGGFSIFLNWNYHTGNRITFPTHILKENGESGGVYLYDAPYNTKLPDYHRLDAGLDWKKARPKGREWDINLSVYNLYNHLNAAFALLDTDENGEYQGLAYGLVPIIPTLTVSYKF